MDEDDFEESRRAPSLAIDGEASAHVPLAHGGIADPRPTRAIMPERRAARPGLDWVRASDLLSIGTGRIAGRGLDFETELARRLRRGPSNARRAMRERADRLPPLSEFGQSPERPPMSRHGLGRI
ncbi:hypothetical protein [Cryobacterium roopkundense]|uniref:Uncharacterized protein n=1 Tax=Cryobacterium roopkundense TaxID=1001240 RepID=A0A7W8ZVZ7_9MICO|nr:hypothetical protein [Cryobacterium roopkundense]MBB5640982.1 hypothetical protein [Cryobacterium roopkundense]